MGSGNFVQVSAFGGTGGRTQTLVPGSATQLFQFMPTGLPGVTDGGDKIYAERVRARVTGQLTRTAGSSLPTPNTQQMAQAFGKVHVFSQDLQELVPIDHNSVPLLMNHDQWFVNGGRPITRQRATQFGSVTTDVRNIEYEFEIPFARDYGERPTDFCPWLPLLDQGSIEFELRPSNALSLYGWTMSGNWTAEVVIDWYTDKQAFIHAPVQSRLYKPSTQGPEYTLVGVGGAKGYDGVVPGCRLAILSWLSSGTSQTGSAHDNGFYPAFAAGGGILFGTNGLNRLDIPWRMQKSINAVSAWVGAFLADTGPIRYRANLSAGATVTDNDMANWPYTQDPANTNTQTSLINDALDFFPLCWTGEVRNNSKISDMQKVNGNLVFSADLTTPPGAPVTHLFSTDEICAFSRQKVLDIMDRMGMSHVERGGQWKYTTKYAQPKAADPNTQWGMPLKIVAANQPGAL